PKLHIAVDRTKAQNAGITERDVSSSLLVSLSGSGQETPTYFLNPNGVLYSVVTQSPQYAVRSLQDLQNVPITAPNAPKGEILGDISTLSRGSGMAGINHYNIKRVIDIYGSVEGRDLGAAGQDVTRIVDAARKNLPRGSDIVIRGQLDTMRTSYTGLAAGL